MHPTAASRRAMCQKLKLVSLERWATQPAVQIKLNHDDGGFNRATGPIIPMRQ